MKSNFRQLAARWTEANDQIRELEDARDLAAEPLNEAAERVVAAKRITTFGCAPRFRGVTNDLFIFDLWNEADEESIQRIYFTLDELEIDEDARGRMELDARRADLLVMQTAVDKQVRYYQEKLSELDEQLAALENGNES